MLLKVHCLPDSRVLRGPPAAFHSHQPRRPLPAPSTQQSALVSTALHDRVSVGLPLSNKPKTPAGRAPPRNLHISFARRTIEEAPPFHTIGSNGGLVSFHAVGQTALTETDDALPQMSQNTSAAANKAATKGKGKAHAGAGVNMDEEVDEKVLRRRLQYKLHQRRHRAKQKQKAATLELEVQNLVAEVETLNRRRQKLLVDNNFFASRGTTGGVPARVAMEYFRLFQFGASPLHIDQQEQFLRAVMTAETEGPDYVGVDTVVTQWRHYCSFFAYTRYEPLSINVTTVGDLTVVLADSIFSIRARHDGVVTLYPSLNGNVELTQKLMGNEINIHGKYRFIFDSAGVITWFSAEWDLVDALQRALGDLDDVSTVLAGANISSSTGQIRVEETKPRVDPRHNVDFLLS